MDSVALTVQGDLLIQGLSDETGISHKTKTKVLDVVRERTQGLHGQLEASFDLSRFMSSHSSYNHLLQAYLGIYRPFERLLGQHHTLVANRYKTTLIENDLMALGATEDEIREVAECCLPSTFEENDSLYGALYVLEGSNLGGQIIYRQIESSLQINQDTGSSFFHGDGERTGLVWKNFLAELEQRVISADRAAEGACAMFNVFEIWLSQVAMKVGVCPQ